ncbi:MAG TPA: FAD-dependent oxidoreductase, partial [Gemmatimonadaceae bacterium]|nr:FAD-dependent oxidoreductase [Gemmatimonadaceae bacterium]
RHAARALDRLGVRCVLSRTVHDMSANVVVLDDGQTIDTDITVWAGGVRPNRSVARLGLPTMSTGHIAVTPRLAVETLEGVYAIGDVARVVEGGTTWPTMERAIEAIWQGSLLARRLAGQWADDDGPTHRLRRDFFYGLSLGPRHSVVVYGKAWVGSRLFVSFRRWLERAYYVRFALVARWLGRSAVSDGSPIS